MRKAENLALEIINQISIKIESTEDNQDQLLCYVAKTCLSSKILSRFQDHFCELAIEALKCLNGSNKVKNIHIVKRTGPSMSKSLLIQGILLDRKLSLGAPKIIFNPRILLTRIDLDTWKTKIWGTQIKVQTYEESSNIGIRERDRIRERCQDIINLGVKAIINHGQIYSIAEQCFVEAGIMCIEIKEFEECEIISFATGCPILSDFSDIDHIKFGEANCIEEIVIGDNKMIKISGCPNPKACTILLRAPTESMLDECERSMHDVLCVLVAAIKNKQFLGGGGAAQIEIAKRLREKLLNEPEKEQWGIESFADSLEILALILAQNGGFDGINLLSCCRKLHQVPDGVWKGINIIEGSISDMLSDHVIEPAIVLQSIIKGASEVVEMILRIDKNTLIPPKDIFVPPF